MGMTIKGRGFPCTLYATDTGFTLYWENTLILTVDSTASPVVSVVDGMASILTVVSPAEGSVSVPSVSFSGDLNTGFYNPAADTIGVATSGATAMYIDTAKIVPVLPVLGTAGTSAAPAFGFAADTDTGMYNPAANVLAFGTNAASGMNLNAGNLVVAGGVTSTGTLIGSAGKAATPGMTFVGDLDTGFYNPAANTIGIATNGATAMYINASAIVPTLPVLGTAGTSAAPAIGFSADTDTGIYNPAANIVAIATNAASAVAVDASGNLFTAGYVAPTRTIPGYGTVSAPGHSFAGDPDTGMYKSPDAENVLAFATSGATAVIIDSAQQVRITDGTVAAPGISFIGDVDTGIYRVGTDELAIAVSGTMVLDMGTAQFVPIPPIKVGTGGLVSNPAIGFLGDLDTGFYNPSANTVALATSGVVAVHANATDVVIDTNLCIGTSGTPATSGAAGSYGMITWDDGYIYVKTLASSGWKRAAIVGW